VKIPVITLLDELFLIGEATKQASILRDVGSFAKGVGSTIKNEALHAHENIGGAVGAMTAPKHYLAEGLQEFKGPISYGDMTTPWKIWQAKDLLEKAHGAIQKEDPTGQGRSRLHRTAAGIGSQAGGIIARKFGILGGIAGTTVGGKVGDLAGRGVDRLRGYHKPPQNPRGY
jgi:hypothetical protein